MDGPKYLSRDGILRKCREHARGRNFVYCGRIWGCPCKSEGSIEEMWKKYSKWLAMRIVTVKKLNRFCGRNANSFHNVVTSLWYIPQCEKYNLNVPHCGNCKIFHNIVNPSVVRLCLQLKFTQINVSEYPQSSLY